MAIAWVIGGGGLLGSAILRALRKKGVEIFSPRETFTWSEPEKLHAQLTAAVQSFGNHVNDADRWEIYWAAGIGTMGSPVEALLPETDAFAVLVAAIKGQPSLKCGRGALALASSAGALFAGNTSEIIDDQTAPTPTTPYAFEKLKQEKLLSELTLTNPKLFGLAARISTLFGPGNSHTKQQGLIAHIARCILRNEPAHVYVPVDTIRDYITAYDAACLITHYVHNAEGWGFYPKIIASGKPTTIAEIISTYRRITRRNPRIVTSASKLTSVYSRRIQFRIPKGTVPSQTSLVVGIAEVMAAERSRYTKASASSNA